MLTVIGIMNSSGAASNIKAKAISIAICGMGVLVCFFWFLIARRSEAFYNHWYEQLKFLEKQYLEPVKTFQIADEFFSKGHITLGETFFRLDVFMRMLRMFTIMQFLALMFSLVWLALGLYFIFN